MSDDASHEDGHGDDGDGHDDHDADHHNDQHGHHSHDADDVAIAVVTVSSSRSQDDDPSGDYLVSSFEEAGHEVVVRELVPDEYDSVQGTVDRLARRKDTDAVVTAGGTGVTPDDVTPGAVRGLFAKTLPGFGELFRRLSYEEIVMGIRHRDHPIEAVQFHPESVLTAAGHDLIRNFLASV